MTRSPKSADAKLQLLLEHEFGKDAKHDEKVLLTHADETVREYAALALGESQLPDALIYLQQAWEQPLLTSPQRSYLTRAVALHRTDAAYDWLLRLIAEGSVAAAEAALQALAIYKHNASLRSRIEVALERSGKMRLQELFATLWGESG